MASDRGVTNVGAGGIRAGGGTLAAERTGVESEWGSPATAVTGVRLERFKYDDAVVRMFLCAMMVWGLVAFLAGLVVALQLVTPSLATASPKAFGWLSVLFGEVPQLTFGRLRPLHTNAAIFAFAGNAIFAAVYYSTQRLCKARMFSDTLSRLHFWGWQAIIVSAALTLPFGITQGKEYAELEWPIDLAIAVVWVGFFGVNFFMTLARRRERHMYVALWFYIATIVTVAVLHVFNSLALPVSGLKSYSIYAGSQDAMVQWWYGHNAVAFFLTTPFLGLMYYFIPKAAERPVFSYRLSIIHFWSLVFLYIWAGPHHLHYTAVPAWASSLGMLFSVMLWMPSWGGMINGLLTLRGAWHRVLADPVLKFFVAGVTFYGMSTFEGPLLSVKSVNALAHYTDWVIAHVHSGALGWNGCLAFGMMYFLLPRLFQTPLWSKRLAEWHFYVGTLGILMYVIPIYAAGITQGLMWRAFTEQGLLKFEFVETVTQLMPFYWIRALGGTLFIFGAVLGAVNFYMTWRNRPAKYEEPEHTAAPLSPFYADAPAPATPFGANIGLGTTLYRFCTGFWHRVWERRPLKFTVMVLAAIVAATLFEAVPTFVISSNVPTIAGVKPYTPLELLGRETYIAEGCYNCHSQMIRPIYAETLRYGEYSKPGEFVYDHPFQWGSRRLGPDLAREGSTSNTAHWHYLHFIDPRSVNPASIMPSYAHLVTGETDFATVQSRVWAMSALGAPYAKELITQRGMAERLARAQASKVADMIRAGAKSDEDRARMQGLENKKVVPLIAYMLRLGTDLNKPGDWVPEFSDPRTLSGKPAGAAPAPAPVAAEGDEEGATK